MWSYIKRDVGMVVIESNYNTRLQLIVFTIKEDKFFMMKRKLATFGGGKKS